MNTRQWVRVSKRCRNAYLSWPSFLCPPPSYECGGHWQMLHLVYCPVSGVSTEFEKPDNRIYPRPPRPPGWGRQASGLRTPQTIRVHWTELYPGQTERKYGDRGYLYFWPLFILISLSLSASITIRDLILKNEGRINDSWIEAGKLGRFINSPSAFCPLYWINIDQKSWCWWVVGVRSVSFHEINNGSVSKRHRPPPPLHPISIHIHHKFCPIYKRMLLQKTIHWDSKLSSKEGTC